VAEAAAVDGWGSGDYGITSQFEEIGEQDGLVAVAAATTEAQRAAEHVAPWAATVAEQALAALTALVEGVGHQRATPPQVGTQSALVDDQPWCMAEPEGALAAGG
jgi:hypothetical protein